MANTGDQLTRIDPSGTSSKVSLIDPLGKPGGEGQVWRLSLAGEAAKIYHHHDMRDAGHVQRIDKLKVMLNDPPKDPAAPKISIAWPRALLKDGSGATIGFTMPAVDKAYTPPDLYLQRRRKIKEPGIDWFYIYMAAQNVAKVCDAVHERGYVIGDLNQRNWLIDRGMTTAIIDTDSFQVRDAATGRVYRCPVGTPEYTASEILYQDFKSVDRRTEHDLFAMAVLIYQFLFGQDPFSAGEYRGRGEAPTETVARIEKGLWLWGRHGQYRPTPRDVPLDALHPELVRLFRRCFDDGHKSPLARPTAKQWVMVLETAINSLAWCGVEDAHVYSGHLRKCTWCEQLKVTGHDRWPTYKKGASGSFAFAKDRLRVAHANGDLQNVLTAVSSNPRFAREADLAGIIADAKKFATVAKAFEGIRLELDKATPDPLAVVKLLAAEPKLDDFARRYPEVSRKIVAIRELAACIAGLESSIAASPRAKNGFAINGERAIEATFLKYEAPLKTRPDLEQRFKTRIKEAQERVRAFEKVTKAIADGDEMAVYNELGRGAGVLATIVEYSQVRAPAELIVSRVDTIRRFIAEASRPLADDDALCTIWESVPNLTQSRLARQASSALNGTPEQRYQHARLRMRAAGDLNTLFADLTAKSGGRISEGDEQRISGAYKEAETRVGSLDRAAGGELLRRVTVARRRLGLFAELRRLGSLPAERDGELARWWTGVKTETSAFVLDAVLSERVKSAVESWRLVEGFLALAGHTPVDEVGLIGFADANPQLVRLPASAAQLVEGLSIPKRVALARNRLDALRAVRDVISKADASKAKSETGERSIVQLWQRNEGLLAPWEAARREAEPRARRAVDRLRRTQLLQEAVSQGDQAQALEAWGKDGVLDDYYPAQPYKQMVEEAAKVAGNLSALVARLRRRDEDDFTIDRLAKAAGALLNSSYANRPLPELNGQSICRLVEFARARAQFVEMLVRVANDRGRTGFLALANAWRDEFGLDHPRISPHRALLEEIVRERKRLGNVIEAAKAGRQDDVVRNWNDALFANVREIRDIAPQIRLALKGYVEGAQAFRALGSQGLTREAGNRVVARWDWLDDAVTHAYVLIGDKRAPSDHRDAVESRFISRSDYVVRSGVEFDFIGCLPVAVVRPVVTFCGERLEGRGSLVLREGGRRVLKYRLHGGFMGLGHSVLEIELDRPASTPELELVATDDGEPVSAWGEQKTDGDGRINIGLGGALSFKRRSVELRLRSSSDADWIEIVHPAERERLIAG